MEINLKPLLSSEERKITFSYGIPIDYCENGYKLSDLVEVSGEVKDMGGYMVLDAKASVKYETECARWENSCVSIDEILKEEIIMSLPLRSLCSETCKGLCPKCGCNKNEKECDCVLSIPDPRWNALKAFSEKK